MGDGECPGEAAIAALTDMNTAATIERLLMSRILTPLFSVLKITLKRNCIFIVKEIKIRSS